MPQADSLSHTVWEQVYNAIRQAQGTSQISQGIVSDRSEAKRVIWVRELSSDPIPVAGQTQDLTFYSGKTRKTTSVLPAVPQKGDIVLLIRTASGDFCCIGIVQPAAEWTAPSAIGFLGPGVVTNRELADGTIQGSKINFSVGLTPPANPVTNDLWLLTGSGVNGEEWLFRYNSSEPGSLKWKFVGGPAFLSEVATNEALTNAAYQPLTTGGPSCGLPRPGDYIVEIGFTGYQTAGATGSSFFMSYDIGGTGAVDADAARIQPVALLDFTGVSKHQVKTGLTAVALTAKYKTATLKQGEFRDRWMKITPIRVS
jgi:hypothetical protein